MSSKLAILWFRRPCSKLHAPLGKKRTVWSGHCISIPQYMGSTKLVPLKNHLVVAPYGVDCWSWVWR